IATHVITDLAIILKPEDDVAIAKREIAAGTVLEDGGGRIEVRQDIRPGHKVARHARRAGEDVIGTDVRPVEYYAPGAMRYFDGYAREDGRVGTRNYVAIISGVNCSAS